MFPVLLFIIDSHGGPWRIIMSNLHGKLIDTGGQIPQNLLSPGKMMSGMLLSEVTQIGSVICNNHMSCTNDKYLFPMFLVKIKLTFMFILYFNRIDYTTSVIL